MITDAHFNIDTNRYIANEIERKSVELMLYFIQSNKTKIGHDNNFTITKV